MKLIRKCESNIPFSLHDSRIIKIEMVDDSLRFYLDRVFEYENNEENYYPACMCFRDIDPEDCNVMVFNKCAGEGNFSGVRYGIKDYINRFADAEFEIITETYGGYSTILEGSVWSDGSEPLYGIINIWTMGAIVFDY